MGKSFLFSSWFRTKSEESSQTKMFKEQIASSQVSMNIKHSEIETQMKMIRLSQEDLKIAKALQPIIATHIHDIAKTFYKTILSVPHLKQILTKHSTVERLAKSLELHLMDMFDGHINDGFLRKRFKVAEVHVRIGLEPKWYIAAFQNVQEHVLRIIFDQILDSKQLLEASIVVSKMFNFEQQVVLESYEKENMRREQEYRGREQIQTKMADISFMLASLSQQTTSSVEQLISSGQDMNIAVQHSADKSKETLQLASEGQQRMKELESRIRDISNGMNDMEGLIEKLSHSSNEIQKIVNLVQQIAEQTNLLALNSAIEAARAGEHGRGFSVVSQEVRKLSEQTRQSVQDVSSLIAQSSQFMQEVVSSIRHIQLLVNKGQEESDQTEVALNQIVISMQTSITEIDRATTKMAQFIEDVEMIGNSTYKVSESAQSLNQLQDELEQQGNR
ncbi:methyl-accepting chemotaxis protein [Brevibacillus laterosporus]|uniref:globin-coupled sensor protein n=2 Tax=Brevibacillus laterosporus TaxID=1465 RepID=UPI00035DE8FB|nr:methyl-accepting chemotaxis protein [Brevibacillus laterosporus]ATO51682.1 methyl-accepting chemotaxis protein [Brevibacillus laterosporus DSM 25]MBG9773125.1 heme transporter CcmD [Brevibacillus laterosporus]MBG9798687.1 heme transporter CcmD [Brevibacillus laterosporus]MBG9803974.1 heme transporter CcmD [Brevibacillus laterosporus]MCR8936965.1 methyl-accepting chemotaxis protein [Brevibacillus laterosporus]